MPQFNLPILIGIVKALLIIVAVVASYLGIINSTLLTTIISAVLLVHVGMDTRYHVKVDNITNGKGS